MALMQASEAPQVSSVSQPDTMGGSVLQPRFSSVT
jgi:hypothetical protein